MTPEHPEWVPDPDTSQETMLDQQRAIAAATVFEDDGVPSPDAAAIDETPDPDPDPIDGDGDRPVVVGIDQAFRDDVAVSAAVAIEGQRIVESVCGKTPLSIPYIPGLLAFREGGPIVEALGALSVEPDLLVLDGNGRIHFREAGIATHVGVVFDVPAIGIAKNHLCGTPARSLDEPLPAGTRVPIRADDEVETEPGALLGHAVQTRQYPNPDHRHVNPVYVSPGHRVAPETAAALAEVLCTGYKLPAPIRLADRAAEDCKG
jgi:deoxyribonuclease V